MIQPGHHTIFGLARRLLLVTLIAAVAVTAGPGAARAAARLDDVVAVPGPDATAIHLRTSERVRYEADLIDGPTRLVVDLSDTTFAWRPGRLDVDGPSLRQIRGSQFRRDVTRIVVELKRAASYTITEDPRGLLIVFPHAGRAAAPRPSARGERRDTGAASPALALQANQREIPGAYAPATAPPSGPVVVAQAPPRPAAPASGRLISLDFKDADVVNLLRILAAESGKNIVIADDVKGKMSITLKNVPWEQTLEIILEARGLEMLEKGNVLRIITKEQLAREREAVAKLAEARAKAEEAKAKAEVEIRQKAAEAALKEQEAQARKLAAEQAFAEAQARGPLVEETIRLAYADPEDVVKTLIGILGIVEGPVPAPPPPPAAGYSPGAPAPSAAVGAQPVPVSGPSPEITSRGITIRAHKPTNSIFIRNYATEVERIKKLIRESLDVRLPQIMISARVALMQRTTTIGLGVRWGGGLAGRAGKNILVGSGLGNPGGGLTPQGVLGGTLDDRGRLTRHPDVTLTGFLPVSPSGLPLSGGNVVNLPGAGAGVAGIAFGLIGTRYNLNLQLDALETENKIRTLARPEIVTVESGKALILQGTEIPYLTSSPNTGTNVTFREAVLKLEVTPLVIREPDATKIKMKLVIDNNEPGAAFATGDTTVVGIDKQRAETEVIVKEGETLVIGGVTKRRESETIQKVPLFGDIPILGWLFKNKTSTTGPSFELVMFITPTVLREPPKGTGPTAPAPPSAPPVAPPVPVVPPAPPSPPTR